MNISIQNAFDIVEEIGGIVGHNINMMDETGHIIASTDSDRIGNFHLGAKHIIDEKLDEMYISPEKSTDMVRAGLNFPIIYDGKVVGVIGITGFYDQVVRYGQIVKKMTEILIRENTEKENHKLEARVKSRFLEDWIFNRHTEQGQSLTERGMSLGIDIALPRRVLVVGLQKLEFYNNTFEGQKLIGDVEDTVSNIIKNEPSGIILRNAARQIILVSRDLDKDMEQLSIKLVEAVEKKHKVKLAVGYDDNYRDIHQNYLHANKAWQSAKNSKDGVCSYTQITMQIFISEISKKVKIEYITRIFSKCTYEEISRWMTILEAYYLTEGSIQESADRLYMHKNTLQYQLKKIIQITGFDVRLASESPTLYMAYIFFKDLKSKDLISNFDIFNK